MISVDSIQPIDSGYSLAGGDSSSTQPVGTNVQANVDSTQTAASQVGTSGVGLYLPGGDATTPKWTTDHLVRSDPTPYAGLQGPTTYQTVPGGTQTQTVTTEPIDFSNVVAPTGATTQVSDTATMTSTEPSALQQVLANLGSLFGSSASGGTGAASPGAVTAVPVGAESTSTGSPMNKLLLLAIVIGIAYYGYKKGWFSKLGGSVAA